MVTVNGEFGSETRWPVEGSSTDTTPEVANAGTLAWSEVPAELTLTGDAARPLNITTSRLTNPVPVSVTSVPTGSRGGRELGQRQRSAREREAGKARRGDGGDGEHDHIPPARAG